MIVDKCGISACMNLTAPQGTNEFLNVNSSMQIDGTLSNLIHLAANLEWDYKSTDKGFVGCIRNMTFNRNTYNLGIPSLSRNADPGCDHGMTKAISFEIDTNYIVAILVCVLILLILLVAVVMHRRKTDYEDKGGAEDYVQGYDLDILKAIYDASPIDSKIAPVGLQGRGSYNNGCRY
ncbi:DE-cadherin-like isoform X2 [Solenopsis invicta]|uniref:DE-cadherin-like isoform X2 n=1 Tax=Solenopsis invicta TaxID=13686 RepID=UPI00193D43AB|nr:DE-cadherin-like isoform X2 [Solenopsis invicta]